jgi:hypothetical protein
VRVVIDIGMAQPLVARVAQRTRLEPGDTVHCAVDVEALMSLGHFPS